MIYDITQELFSCKVFPGDPAPERRVLASIAEGSVCNVTAFSMCAHNGTHVDAPAHFIDGGRTVDQLPPEVFAGDCWVQRHTGEVSAADAEVILRNAEAAGAAKRILIAGKATLTAEAAQVFAAAKLLLYGNESQTVGPENAPMAVHLILLGADMALLEGVVLTGVETGKYFLSAAPMNLAGADGAPCRALLIR